MSDTIACHNLNRGISRKGLTAVRGAGLEHRVAESLKRPPSRGELSGALAAHPILMERPVVFAPRGAKLCRPAEEVQALIG
jgi:arsenate reductase